MISDNVRKVLTRGMTSVVLLGGKQQKQYPKQWLTSMRLGLKWLDVGMELAKKL